MSDLTPEEIASLRIVAIVPNPPHPDLLLAHVGGINAIIAARVEQARADERERCAKAVGEALTCIREGLDRISATPDVKGLSEVSIKLTGKRSATSIYVEAVTEGFELAEEPIAALIAQWMPAEPDFDSGLTDAEVARAVISAGKSVPLGTAPIRRVRKLDGDA